MQRTEPISAFTFSGVANNVYQCAQGEGLPKHDHVYPHLTMCVAGQLIVRKEGIERVLRPGDTPLLLKANEWHELEAGEGGATFVNQFESGLQA